MSCKEQMMAVHKDFIVTILRSSAQSVHELTLGNSSELFQLMLCHHVPLCNFFFFWYFILFHNESAKESLTHSFMWFSNCHEVVSIASQGRAIKLWWTWNISSEHALISFNVNFLLSDVPGLSQSLHWSELRCKNFESSSQGSLPSGVFSWHYG